MGVMVPVVGGDIGLHSVVIVGGQRTGASWVLQTVAITVIILYSQLQVKAEESKYQ